MRFLGFIQPKDVDSGDLTVVAAGNRIPIQKDPRSFTSLVIENLGAIDLNITLIDHSKNELKSHLLMKQHRMKIRNAPLNEIIVEGSGGRAIIFGGSWKAEQDAEFMYMATSFDISISSTGYHFYDRNPAYIFQIYSAGAIVPHAITTRWTYTVAAGKRFHTTSAIANIVRDAAATTAGLVEAHVRRETLSSRIVQALAFQIAVGGAEGVSVGHSVILAAAEVLTGRTADASTGGTNVYVVSLTGVEADI